MATRNRYLGGALGALAMAAVSTAPPARATTATPIKHVVVIFPENVSFDHYFGTYPNAKNPDGEPGFWAAPNTPSVNGLTGGLLTANPNSHNPFRLARNQAATCDQDHEYTNEQKSFNAGLMDKFPEFVGVGSPGCPDYGFDKNLVMGYFDGNTVTALWNYAQHFAMSDNSFNTTFGPSTPGHINLISGQTNGASPDVPGETISGTIIGDPQPTGDVCTTRDNVKMVTGKNIGDLLNAKGISWGFFQGGFDLTITNPDGSTGCKRSHTSSVTGVTRMDYIPHHQPFQYYAQTANLNHIRPSSVSAIGSSDAANHQYDIHDFFDALDKGNFPAVSFLKPAGYQDGHAGYSSPLDEQTFVVQQTAKEPGMESTAVIIAWDDSDGWYDHQMGPIVSQSNTLADALTGPGSCGKAPPKAAQGRCGYGPRLPLLVVSPYAKRNFVDHSVTDQSSILRAIEDNWGLGRIGKGSFDTIAGSLHNMFNFSRGAGEDEPRKVILDEKTGAIVEVSGGGDDAARQ